jgi:hypothetical protein
MAMIRQRPILATRRFPAPRIWSNLLLVLVVLAALSVGVRWLLRSDAGADPDDLPSLSGIFTPEVRHWSPLIFAWASAYHVDPNLIATVIQIESCGDPTAVSSSGARGLFQVMPFNFSPGEDMFEVLTNGRRGMEYLASGLQIASGNAGLALAGYNGGHGVINIDPARWSSETKRYYQWGNGIYTDAANGLTDSPTMQAWLQAGGTRLCQKASVDQRQTS